MKQQKGYFKPTNELWLTAIPLHWEFIKIKYIFNERNTKGCPGEPLLAATQNKGVVPKEVYGNRTVEATKDLHLLKLVKRGDFVISLRSFQGGIEYAYYQGIISPAYTIMMSKKDVASDYFRHIFKSKPFIELLQLCVTGIREGQNIDYQKLKNHSIPLPPLKEQGQIVKFLDWKLAQIDKLIAAKKKQMELLSEQKQAIINQTVTKGLNLDVPMKSSGIDGIDIIPYHWDIQKCRHFSTLQNGISEAGEFFTSGTAFVGYGDVYKNYELPKAVVGVANSNEKQQIIYSVKEGDIFFTRTSETLDEAGFSSVCTHTIPHAVFSGFLIRMRPQKGVLDSKFSKYYFRSTFVREYFTREMNLVTRASLGQNLIKDLPVLMPPIEEQRLIGEFLQIKDDKNTNAINKITCEIDLLLEYSNRLISDVVTGKIDVRNVHIPDDFIGGDFAETTFATDADTETATEEAVS